ncbi:MAG: autotransporter-associated beta strand repeat-containing protein [Tepidisphaeraceae bacterium]|jgi:fibronectin-binding autotransporter adhesin
MNLKPNSKKARLVILAAVPVVASIFAPGSAGAATQTWSGVHSNFVGTTTNWVNGTPAGSNSSTTNTDLAQLPDFLTGSGGNPGNIYIATTSNQNTTYSLGAFELIDASGPNNPLYSISNNNTGGSTVDLYLNGTTVNGTANTVLADTTTGESTTLEVGTGGPGAKAGTLPLAVVLGNTTNNVYSAPGDLVNLTSNVSENTPGSSFTVTGGGSFALTGANTFTGGVTANASTLVAGYSGGASSSQSSTGTSASNVILNSSTLSSLPTVTSYIAGSVSVSTGSNIIAPGGNGTSAVGTLDIAGALTLNGSSTLDFDLAGTSADQLNLGTLSISGKPTINIDNANGPSGSFVLATYATNNSLSNSSFNFTNTPTGYTWDVTSTEIELVASANAANVTWNVTPVSGSVSGTWNTVTGNWTGGTPVNNLYKSGDTANFNDISGGTSGLITVVTGGVTPLNTIINNTNTSYKFTDADGANGIGGSGSLTKNGTGTAELESPNSYNSGTLLNGGTLIADGDATLGNATGGITFAGGTLQAGAAIGSTGTPSQRSITVNTGGGAFNTNGFSSVFSAAAAIGDTFTVTGGGSLELDGAVTFSSTGALNVGSGATVKLGDSGAVVTQINSSNIDGKLVITSALRLNTNDGALISSAGGTGEIDVAYGGTVGQVTTGGTTYTTYSAGVAITNLKATPGGTIDVPIKLNSNNVAFTAADVTQPNATFVPGNFTVAIGGTTAGDGTTIDGVISGNSDVNIANGASGGGGAGSLVLGAANLYTGTTLFNQSGTVQLAVSNALPIHTDAIFGTISGGIGPNTTLDLDGNTQQIDSLSSGQFAVAADQNITNNGGNPATLVISGSTTPANSFSGVLSDGTGGLSLIKQGSSTLSLSGTSSYSGGTTISGGTVQTASSTTPLGSGTVTVNSPAVLDLDGNSPLIGNLSGSGTVDNVSAGGNPTFTLSPFGSSNFSGVIKNTTGSVAVNVYGIGTQGLSGSNTYTGGTTVSAGTLVINPTSTPATTSALPTGGSVTITSALLQLAPGVSGGSGPAATSSVEITSLSITGNGQLDVNNNHIIITYGSSDPLSTIAGYIKSGYNGGGWNGPGIISTAAQTLTNGLKYGLGYADGADGKVSGLVSGQIEVAYTLLGDANLDGIVNAADFTILAANFNQPVTGWDQGDFNYDGIVNAADFTDLAANFNQSDSGADVSAGDVAALDAFATANGLSLPTSSVPEPATTGLLAMGAIGMLARRRRRST